jgi:hypothetical protein
MQENTLANSEKKLVDWAMGIVIQLVCAMVGG